MMIPSRSPDDISMLRKSTAPPALPSPQARHNPPRPASPTVRLLVQYQPSGCSWWKTGLAVDSEGNVHAGDSKALRRAKQTSSRGRVPSNEVVFSSSQID